ncbi:DeoR family transcriptional regulator [Streptomyces hainanensis]|uniref:DeoR family transcriptional regulator n=2 Tax=Streptomyces hainanensis TaxID=402648 RepID=A0A4R4TJ52_9ACTN|nr:DeoR family transcriptional regulator [Streptomyces hainanensis]
MLVAQRHELLLRELKAHGALKIVELAARLRVSSATIRRDLAELAEAGRVARVRGGAMLVTRRGGPDQAHVRQWADASLPAPATGARDEDGPVLGLLVPSMNYYYPQLVTGVRSVAARRGARVVIGLTDYAEPSDLDQIDDLVASGVAGLLITTAEGHHTPTGTLDRLRATGLPFVLAERQPRDPFEPCEFVVSDHRQGAYAAVRHFVALGHDRVALYVNGSPTAPLIQEGHAAAVRSLGLDPSAPVVDGGRPRLGSAEAIQHYDGFIERCLAGGVRAALVHSDHDAIELTRRLRVHGLRTPDDLALIAYDDEIASLAEVPLTAVAPPKHELGEQATRLLLDRLDAPEPPAVRQLVLQPRLVVRASCGAAAHRHA